MEICPVGRCSYPRPLPRCLTAEQLISEGAVEANCKNSADGCNVEKPAAEMDAHEAECDFWSVPCPECQEIVAVDKVVEHLKDLHEGAAQEADKNGRIAMHWYILEESVDSGTRKWVSSVCSHAGNDFLLRFKWTDDDRYCSWVQLVGTEADARKYRAQISISGRGGLEMDVRGGRVYPIDMTSGDIAADPGCFQLGGRQALQFRTARTDLADNPEETARHKLTVVYNISEVPTAIGEIIILC